MTILYLPRSFIKHKATSHIFVSCVVFIVVIVVIP